MKLIESVINSIIEGAAKSSANGLLLCRTSLRACQRLWSVLVMMKISKSKNTLKVETDRVGNL